MNQIPADIYLAAIVSLGFAWHLALRVAQARRLAAVKATARRRR